jgi:hypothetical protein
MERKIVSVTTHENGWQIQAPEHAPRNHGEIPQALSAAWTLARDLHRSTGHPTAIKVSVGVGDGVMMGYHG